MHVQGNGNAKETQTMLRHTKPDTAQINYVQPVEDFRAICRGQAGRDPAGLIMFRQSGATIRLSTKVSLQT